MTRWGYIDGVDHTSLARLDSLQLQERAYGCDVGQGGFNRDDASLALMPAMKRTIWEETAASPTRMFTGYTSQRNLDRGPLPKVEEQRQFDVSLLDLNTLWDDPILEGSDANRPAETDYERMTWLIGTDDFAALGIAAGVVPNTNTANLDARDYRGQHPRDVAEECLEAAAKNCFLYDYGDGPLVYYDLSTGTSLSSTAKISSVLADVDEASGVFAAGVPKLVLDPDRVYAKVRFEYATGHVTVTRAATVTNYRNRGTTINDSTVKTATGATNKANKYLDRSQEERYRLSCAVNVPAAKVNDIRAGMRIEVKLPHLAVDAPGSLPGLPLDDWTWRRIITRTVLPQHGEHGAIWDRYTIILEFDDTAPAGFGGRSGPGSLETPASLTQYQLTYEVGGTYGPAMDDSYLTFPPEFAFATTGDTSAIVSRTPEHNIPWEFRPCGIDAGAPGGLATREAWYRFQVDLSDPTLLGVRFKVAPFLVYDAGDPDHDYTDSPSGDLVGTDTVACGIHCSPNSDGSELSHDGQWNLVGHVGDQGGEVFVGRSHLIDDGSGYCWFVLAPNWTIDPHLVLCEDDPKPWGYGLTGDPGDANEIVTAFAVSGDLTTNTLLAALGDGKSDHDALSGLTNDDHTQYQTRVEKAAASGYPSLDAGALVPTAQLGTGAASSVTVLLGNQTWGTLAGTGAGGLVQDVDEDGTSATNWTGLSGTWSSDGTTLNQTDATSSQREAAYASATPNAVRVLEAEVQGVDSGFFAGILIGSGANGNNWLQLGVDDSSNAASFKSGLGGSTLLTLSTAITTGTWYKLRMELAGQGVTCWIDGTLIGSYIAATALDISYIGLVSWARSKFRNIKGWTLDLPA